MVETQRWYFDMVASFGGHLFELAGDLRLKLMPTRNSNSLKKDFNFSQSHRHVFYDRVLHSPQRIWKYLMINLKEKWSQPHDLCFLSSVSFTVGYFFFLVLKWKISFTIFSRTEIYDMFVAKKIYFYCFDTFKDFKPVIIIDILWCLHLLAHLYC